MPSTSVSGRRTEAVTDSYRYRSGHHQLRRLGHGRWRCHRHRQPGRSADDEVGGRSRKDGDRRGRTGAKRQAITNPENTISSGIDTFSRTTFDQVLASVQRSGVPIYCVGLSGLVERSTAGATGPIAMINWPRAKERASQRRSGRGAAGPGEPAGSAVQREDLAVGRRDGREIEPTVSRFLQHADRRHSAEERARRGGGERAGVRRFNRGRC